MSVDADDDADIINVAVIGGGIGGFALALALQKRGMTSVRVFERDQSFDERRQGYGVCAAAQFHRPRGALSRRALATRMRVCV